MDTAAGRDTGDEGYRRAIADIAAGLAHEVRNPLALVKANIDVLEAELREGGARGDEAKRFKTMRREIDHINAIMTEFIEFSKNGAAVKLPFKPAAYIKGVVDDFASAYKSIAITFGEDIGEARVLGDMPQIERLVANLLKNAVEAIDEAGGAEGRIDVKMFIDGGRLVIEVIDNGAGFGDNNAEKLLLPFYTTKKEGTGLGLHLCQQIAREHGGALTLSPNESGVGAKAALALPVGDW